jgi:hypothetical protein
MKQVFALAVGVAIMFGMTYDARSLSANDKIKICHRTGNGSAHVLSISWHAVPAHLNHGDSLDAAQGLEKGDDCVITEDVEK